MDLDKFERLFRAAQMHPADERTSFVNAACEGDSALRNELLSLLNAHENADQEAFLDKPIIDNIGALLRGVKRDDIERGQAS